VEVQLDRRSLLVRVAAEMEVEEEAWYRKSFLATAIVMLNSKAQT